MKKITLLFILFCLWVPSFSQSEAVKKFQKSENKLREYLQDVFSHENAEILDDFTEAAVALYNEGDNRLAAKAVCRVGEFEIYPESNYFEKAVALSEGLDPEVNLEARIFLAMADGFNGDAYEAWQRARQLVPMIDGLEDKATVIKLTNAAAQTAQRANDTRSAIELFEKIRSLDPGKDLYAVTYYIEAMGNYANYKSTLGAKEEALTIFIESTNCYESFFSKDSSPYALMLYVYYSGIVLMRAGEYNEDAMQFLMLAEKLFKRTLGEGSLELIRTRRYMANILIDEKKYEEAKPYLNLVLLEAAEMLGKTHSELIYPYYYYGLALQMQGKTDLAREMFQESERIRSELHSMEVNALLSLGILDVKEKAYERACEEGQALFDIEKEYLRGITLALPQVEREQSWKQQGALVMESVMALAANASKGGPLLYDTALLTKGLLMSTSSRLNALIEKDETGRLSALRDEYSSLYRHAEVLSSGSGEQQKEAEVLRRKAALIESELIGSSAALGDMLSGVDVTWQEVSNALGKDEAAIEFVRFNSFVGKYVYAASVLLPGKEPVNVILPDLNEKLILQEAEGSAYTSSKLFKAVFEPLLPYLRSCRRVWFSPTGELSIIPLENIRSTSGKATASELLSLRRLSSTRVLTQKHGSGQWNSAALFGGLDYDLSPEEKEYYAEVSTSRRSSIHLHSWSYLPGSLSEVEAISGLLEDVDTEIVTGGEGVEERFKALSGKGVNLLHIATHGFYLDEVSRAVFNLSSFELPETALMECMGLVMSGANTRGVQLHDNGLLTAAEISLMDLSDCDLVVLSACGTGLGTVNFEESYGLVRGFKKAGCHSILMTLWEVDDKATAIFMRTFYSEKMQGCDNGEALEKAKATVRSIFQDPKYWAGFVLID